MVKVTQDSDFLFQFSEALHRMLPRAHDLHSNAHSIQLALPDLAKSTLSDYILVSLKALCAAQMAG